MKFSQSSFIIDVWQSNNHIFYYLIIKNEKFSIWMRVIMPCQWARKRLLHVSLCVCVCVCVQCISIIMHYNNLLRIKMHCAQNSYVSVYGWAVMLIILIGLNKKALCKATIIENTLALTTFMVHIVHSMFLGYSFVRSFGCCFFFLFQIYL